MLRLLTPLIVLSTLVGCSCTHPAPYSTTQPVAELSPIPNSELCSSYPASALVFTPPVSYGHPALDLSRESRQPMAFGGFQQSTTAVTYIQTQDRQSTFCPDSYDRWTVTVQVGTSVR